MSRQPTLGKFGFKKTIEHRGSQSSIRLPDFVAKTQTSVKCSGCSKTFVNQQGLTIHERCVHGVAVKRKTVVESSCPTKAPRSESDSEIKEGVCSTMDKLLSLVAEESSNSEIGR